MRERSALGIPSMTKNEFGFSLVELLVSIAILAIIAGVLVPVVSNVRYKALQAESGSNLRTISTAMHLYSSDNDGELPRLRDKTEGGQPWSGLWPEKMQPYLGTFVDNRSPDIFFDPLAEVSHPRLSDFGANDLLFVNDPEAEAYNLARLREPSRTVILAQAKEKGDGDWRGTWYFRARHFIESGDGTNLAQPTDRDTGVIMYSHADGSVSEEQWDVFLAQREKLLDPDYQ
ncbi:type II secretion system protein [Rubellicoccus peritrichatus]|uniref:Type II secretion system protein n=1 Tax=Rubellicoccus peritrichatus TaxID=3080537 RepID=A0AAQ3LDE6_9BACT|nr:type II secretion system protein [Puniceicoccus sp. CR14]WOO43670.1 type II secretion system protein [Puniceicoccus sp. CR14]